jgi:uncharacterized membrane protein (UPF0127 family)
MRTLTLVVLSAILAGCSGDKPTSMEEFNARRVTLPDGTTVQAEVMTQQQDMARGMMFRDTFPEGKGMLFIHGGPGNYSYWMYQVRVPLDIIWMDTSGNVVEMVENAAPCKTRASECPNYGGTKQAVVVLELPGGYGRKHGVAVGTKIRF